MEKDKIWFQSSNLSFLASSKSVKNATHDNLTYDKHEALVDLVEPCNSKHCTCSRDCLYHYFYKIQSICFLGVMAHYKGFESYLCP